MVIEILYPVGLIAVRNIFGWATNSFKDGKIQSYEWNMLGISMARIGGLAIFVYFGLGELGTDISATGSAGLAGLFDVLRNDVLEPIFKKK